MDEVTKAVKEKEWVSKYLDEKPDNLLTWMNNNQVNTEKAIAILAVIHADRIMSALKKLPDNRRFWRD